MAYIGRGLDKISNIELLDAITFTDSAGPYNITQSSTAFVPAASNALVISIDGVVQDPSSYTISVATITFDSVMAATSTMNFMYQIGVGVITAPSDDSVTTAKLADLSVTAGKLAATQDLSTKTITLPASVSGLGTGITNTQLAGSIDVTTKITGVVPTANLGSGTASSSTYLAGDQTYKEIVATDIAWQSVVTAATLTAVAGRGYPLNTTSNACTVTLPAAASVGDQIIFTDYLRTWGTNAVTINPNSLKFQGYTTPQPVYDTNGESVHIVYMDVTQGWVPINDGAVAFETDQSYSVDFLVIAGGGGGGGDGNTTGGGAGGAGGLRTSYGSTSGGGASAQTALTLTASTVYTITVGAGGTGRTSNTDDGSNGGVSSISGSDITDVTTVGGGRGAYINGIGTVGGSGGGNTYSTSTPAAGTADEGFSGGTAASSGGQNNGGGGGGGAASAGGNGSTSNGGNGGTGIDSTITGSTVGYAGGGGAGVASGLGSPPLGTVVDGGGAGGTAGGNNNGNPGDDNTGGGGGGGSVHTSGSSNGGNGGSGIVVLRMADAKYSGTTTGSPTVATNVGGSGETVLTFNAIGSYTA